MEQDIFLWLKRPTIAEIRAVLKWAHQHALRVSIQYSERGEAKKNWSDEKFENIIGHIDRTAKLFFRIIVRKGMNKIMLMDDKKYDGLLDIAIHCVSIADRKYYVNLYLSSRLLGQLKRKFALSEKI